MYDDGNLVSDEDLKLYKLKVKEFLSINDGIPESNSMLLNRNKINLMSKIIAYGQSICIGYIERDVCTFDDFSKVMVSDFGESITKYLKCFYFGAKYEPHLVAKKLDKKMDDYNSLTDNGK